MIQDIGPHRFSGQYRPEKPDKDSRLAVVRGRELLLKREGERLEFPCYGEALPKEGEPIYLFSIDERKYFLCAEKPEAGPWAGAFGFYRPDQIQGRGLKWLRFAAATALQLAEWYGSNRFCGACGGEMEHAREERMVRCKNCAAAVYPRISPAIIAGVIDGERILVTKYAQGDHKRYALIAGFTEVGETAEQTVRREVWEETGVRVRNIRYYKSQPWAFSSTLLLGFFCELEGPGEIILDLNELSEGRWMEREELPPDTEGISLTHEMMALFREKGRAVLD